MLVYQDQMRTEHYRRIDTGWETEIFIRLDDLLGFEALGCALRLEDAYAGVPLPSERGRADDHGEAGS